MEALVNLAIGDAVGVLKGGIGCLRVVNGAPTAADRPQNLTR
ncbi:hypothetical protein [Corynebacterium pyruviciproducens]|uniref:Uncharacterized protein n=1 Tax=Corynebacterium pyruviciproducens TaxID=598660 RepID=A0AAF1BX02_9CORY|nr:hypothetical protein [Corynebacterium pyruviciproducens]WOT02917.1 hypothetical protein CYJ47_03875 [Corynebacterium pyruviciproducens]